MAPLPPRPEDDIDKAQIDDINVDLSYLSQSGQRERARALIKEGKSVNQVRMDLGQLSLQESTPLQEKPVKKLKLKSNSVRDRMHPVGNLMLRFDGKGIAEFAESHLEEVKAHMALRPGRFRILSEESRVVVKTDAQEAFAALEAARAALETAKQEVTPEPELEPASEPALEPEPAPASEPEQPKAKPRAKKKTTRKKKVSSVK